MGREPQPKPKVTLLHYRGYQLRVDDVDERVTIVRMDNPDRPVVFNSLEEARAWIDTRQSIRREP